MKREERRYESALATRNFEIELFWKRSLFFWGFIASAFVGYATLLESHEKYAVLISCFGFICSVAWTLVNRGSKYWQENWEYFVESSEDEVTGNLFKDRAPRRSKSGWLSSASFSVSRITIALSDFTTIVWFILLCCPLLPKAISSDDIFEVVAVLFTLLFALAMVFAGRSSDARRNL
jgi:hypothetical protein